MEFLQKLDIAQSLSALSSSYFHDATLCNNPGANVVFKHKLFNEFCVFPSYSEFWRHCYVQNLLKKTKNNSKILRIIISNMYHIH